jgi:hypothetical protein
MFPDTGAGHGPISARTYRGTDNGGLGGFVSTFPGGLAICGIAFLLAPLRWHTSIAIAVPVALVFFGAAYWLWRLSRRLRRASLTVSTDGVTIVNAGRRRDLSWDEVLRFRPGTTPAASAFRGQVPVVIADLTDGASVAIDALRVDHGRLAADKDRAKVEQRCKQIEWYRPNAARFQA